MRSKYTRAANQTLPPFLMWFVSVYWFVHLKGNKTRDVSLYCRAQMNAFNLAVCSLPGDRRGKRRSLVADLGTNCTFEIFYRIF